MLSMQTRADNKPIVDGRCLDVVERLSTRADLSTDRRFKDETMLDDICIAIVAKLRISMLLDPWVTFLSLNNLIHLHRYRSEFRLAFDLSLVDKVVLGSMLLSTGTLVRGMIRVHENHLHGS